MSSFATVAKPQPRGRPPRPGLRESILQAAEAIFTERDYHEVQMDDLAGACGVGKGTLYRYFRSKRDLYLAVMFDGIGRLHGEIEAVVRTGEAPARKIEHIVRCTLGYFWDRRRFFALIHQNEHKPDHDVREWFRRRQQLVRLVQEALDQAIADGEIRRVDARIATEILFGMMRAVNRYRGREDDMEILVAAVVDMLMRGVGTPRGQRALTRVQEA
jgi:TetR/AcrR family transcriptional regulator, fatty acid metabolism regulator protein